MPPELAQLIEQIAQATGLPPGLILDYLTFLVDTQGEQAGLDFLTAPAEQQRQALEQFQQQQGGPPGPGQPPPVGAPPTDMGPPGPPLGAPLAPSLPTGGPPVPMGGPPPGMGPGGPPGPPMLPPPGMGPGMMMPPPGMMGPPPGMMPPPPPAPPKPKESPKAPEPKVIPWKPASVDKITKRSPWKDKAFTWDEIMDFAARAEKYWQPRQQMIAEQQRIIYRRPIFEAADGTPLNPAEGEVLFLRSKPARDFARYLSLSEPVDERIRRQMKPRVRSEKVVDATQTVENMLRDQDRRDQTAWLERASLGDPQPPLPYKIVYLLGAQGGIGWEYKWNDGPDQERHPYKMQPVPWSEIFQIGGLMTLRITRMPLSEARAQEPAIAALYPKKDDKNRPVDYPADETKVKIIGCADVWGQWWGLCWDFEEGPRKGKKDGRKERWIVEPQELNYGIPYYRVLLPWATGAPALDDDQDERIRHTGRGLLADRLGDTRMQDQLTSAMATGAVKAIDPPVTLYLSPDREKDENGVIKPPSVNRGIGGKTYMIDGEKLEVADTSFTAARDVANMLGMLGADDNDASPAVLAGRDAAPSGFARALGSEAASALTVDPLQRAVVAMKQMVDADRCVLLWRALSGDDPLITELAVAGNDGEMALTAKDLELAGNETKITYRETSMATRMQLADLMMRLVSEEIIPKVVARDELGFEEPEVLERQILREQAVALPPFKEALIEREVQETGDADLIGMFQRGLARVQNQGGPGGQGGPPGMPSPPGAPPMPGGSAVPPQIMG